MRVAVKPRQVNPGRQDVRISGDAADKAVRDFSGGERRRIMLARLMARSADILLLDEPTNALDTAGQKLFANLMSEHLARGGLIMAATHTPLGVTARTLRVGEVS